MKINECSSEEELRCVIVANFSILLDCGFVKPATSVKMEDRVDIVHAITLHYAILRSKAEMDQFAEGLQSCGVLNALRQNSTLTKSFFTIGGNSKLTTGEHLGLVNVVLNCGINM